MKRKTGVVVQVERNLVSVRTVQGEFFNLRLQGEAPNIGDIYTAPIAISNSDIIKKLTFIGVIVLILVVGKIIYNHFAPSATVIVNIPPTMQLKVNQWDKIVEAKATRPAGRKLLDSINLKNKSLNKGLEILFEEAKNKKFIDDSYIESNGKITIYISGDNIEDINLFNFVKYARERRVSCQVNYDGIDPTLKAE